MGPLYTHAIVQLFKYVQKLMVQYNTDYITKYNTNYNKIYNFFYVNLH